MFEDCAVLKSYTRGWLLRSLHLATQFLSFFELSLFILSKYFQFYLVLLQLFFERVRKFYSLHQHFSEFYALGGALDSCLSFDFEHFIP